MEIGMVLDRPGVGKARDNFIEENITRCQFL